MLTNILTRKRNLW